MGIRIGWLRREVVESVLRVTDYTDATVFSRDFRSPPAIFILLSGAVILSSFRQPFVAFDLD
jgi:hypothetical protein